MDGAYLPGKKVVTKRTATALSGSTLRLKCLGIPEHPARYPLRLDMFLHCRAVESCHMTG